ncbi:MAG: hypothetical protein AAFO93_02070 [Pseudomonadota bacterium]
MFILSKTVDCIRRDRDFGRLEAWVTLEVFDRATLPVRKRRVFVSLALDRIRHARGDTRHLIEAEAARIAALMPNPVTDRGPLTAVAA